MAQTDTTGQLSWLLDNLVDQVEHVQQALILSRDGLVVAASRGLTPEDSEHLSALAAGLQSLASGRGGSRPPGTAVPSRPCRPAYRTRQGGPAVTSVPARCGRPSSRWTLPSC